MLNPDLARMKRLAEDAMRMNDTSALSYTLATYVLAFAKTMEAPPSMSEDQAKLVLDAEKKLFTLDGSGKVEKKAALNELLIELYGWSPWQGE